MIESLKTLAYLGVGIAIGQYMIARRKADREDDPLRPFFKKWTAFNEWVKDVTYKP